MTVFKSFFKVAYQRKITLLIPVIISVAFSILISISVEEAQTDFKKTQPDVVIINHDKGELGEGLLSYLEEKVIFHDAKEENLEDLLFYRQVYLTLVIPETFSETFIQTGEVLEAEILVDSSKGYIAQSYINEYLGDVSAFMKLGYSPKESIEKVLNAKSSEPSVLIYKKDGIATESLYLEYTRLEVYPVILLIMSVLVPTLAVFRQKGVKERSEIATLSSTKRNTKLFMSALVYSHIIWGFVKGLSFMIFKDSLNTNLLGYSLLNSYVYLWVVIAISFFVSEIAKTENMQVAIANVTSLGISFISGVFVPLSLLSPTIIAVAKLFPIYWNVEVVRSLQSSSLQSIGKPILIQLLFVALFISLGLYVSRNRSINQRY